MPYKLSAAPTQWELLQGYNPQADGGCPVLRDPDRISTPGPVDGGPNSTAVHLPSGPANTYGTLVNEKRDLRNRACQAFRSCGEQERGLPERLGVPICPETTGAFKKYLDTAGVEGTVGSRFP